MMIPYSTTVPLIAVDHVSLTLGGRPILRDVTGTVMNIERQDVVQGQIVCVLGPSGIGKTQLARVMSGLIPPTAGAVRVLAGETMTTVRKGLVGLVPQNYPLFLFATVWDNIMIAAKHGHGALTAAVVTRAKDLLEEFKLTPYRDYYPRDLSGGTRQRVAIVRQMICSDHYIIMDEPFSGLDLINKARACEVIQRAANLDTHNTIIVNTHDVTEGMSIADTVWMIGREQQPNGMYLEGAKIMETYDLAAEGLAWHPDIMTDATFLARVSEVKARFKTLQPA